VAAQLVTGIGFLGSGLIFVRRDSARGLTTAAAIWLIAAVVVPAPSDADSAEHLWRPVL